MCIIIIISSTARFSGGTSFHSNPVRPVRSSTYSFWVRCGATSICDDIVTRPILRMVRAQGKTYQNIQKLAKFQNWIKTYPKVVNVKEGHFCQKWQSFGTMGTIVNTWWPLGEHLATTWHPLGEHLATTIRKQMIDISRIFEQTNLIGLSVSRFEIFMYSARICNDLTSGVQMAELKTSMVLIWECHVYMSNLENLEHVSN